MPNVKQITVIVFYSLETIIDKENYPIIFTNNVNYVLRVVGQS